MNTRQYYVYILASRSRTLYVGVTNDLKRRVWEHREKLSQGFSARYNVARLVWYETTGSVSAAIEREKQIRGWRRSKKVALLEAANPTWEDLSAGWFDADQGCDADNGTADPSLRSG